MESRNELGVRIMLAAVILFIVVVSGCSKRLPSQGDLSGSQFNLISEDSTQVSFPQSMKGKNFFLTFIFTHCPDICPMTTNNMQVIERELEKNDIHNMEFVVVSFDPVRDTPSIMKEYAELRGINLNRWHMLTGRQDVVDSLRKKLQIVAMRTDTVDAGSPKSEYYFVHTDRITLIDNEGRIRGIYKGSEIDKQMIVDDVKKL